MTRKTVAELQSCGVLLVEDGNHGEYRPRPDEFAAAGVPFIRAADMSSGVVDFVGAGRISVIARARIRKGIGASGDVILSHKGTVGRVAVAPFDSPDFVCSPQTTFWRSLDPDVLDQRYLRYVMHSADFVRQLDVLKGQTDMAPYVSLSDQRSMKIDLPEISVQRAIAEVLGALDDKIAANDRVARSALELGDTLFLAARSSDETRSTIGELADRGVLEFGDGYRTKRAEHGQPGLRILRAGDVRDFRIFPGGDDFVSNGYLRQIGPKASQVGDIIMTTKGTVGRVAVVPPNLDQVVYSPQICYFRVRDRERLDVGYLAAWFRSADLENQTSSLMYKSDMAPYINLRDIRSLSLPLPDSSEQRGLGIVQCALLDRFDACGVENERLARTRAELLPLLMSGRVRIKDSEAAVREVL